jgi:hypothetical protein
MPTTTLTTENSETLLIQSAIAEPESALAAWNAFCAQAADIEALDNGSYRLFPLVAVNLKDFSHVPQGNYLQSVLKHAWARTFVFITEIRPILEELREAGIECLVFGGALLAFSLHRHAGGRPGPPEAGFLVRPDGLDRAISAIARRGWTSIVPRPEIEPGFIRFGREIHFTHLAHGRIRLRWHFLGEPGDFEADHLVWNGAVACSLPGCEARTPDLADQFLQVCLDGCGFDSLPALTDAAQILRHGFDWDRLASQARLHRHIGPVQEMIRRLDQLGLGVPSLILERWRSLEATPLERTEMRCRLLPPPPRWHIKQEALRYLRAAGQPRAALAPEDLWIYAGRFSGLNGILRRLAFLYYVLRWRHLLTPSSP